MIVSNLRIENIVLPEDSVPKSVAPKVELPRQSTVVEQVEQLKLLLQDIEGDDKFKNNSNLLKASLDDIRLQTESVSSTGLIPGTYCVEKFINSKNELHKQFLVDTYRSQQFQNDEKSEAKLLILDESFPSQELTTSLIGFSSNATTKFEYPSSTAITTELPSLKSYSIMQMVRIKGDQIIIVYRPEVRKKPPGIAIVNCGQTPSYSVQYYPLTSANKDPFDGQYVKMDNSRNAIAIRDTSTSLKVASITKNWAYEEEAFIQSCLTIKADDFIRDFSIETIGSLKSIFFISILMRNNKIKTCLIDVDQKKVHTVHPIVSTPDGKQLEKDSFILLDSPGFTPVGLESRVLPSQPGSVGVFLLGFSLKGKLEKTGNEEQVPATLSFVFKLDSNNPLNKLDQGVPVKQQLSKNSTATNSTKDQRYFLEFEQNEILRLSSIRTRVSSALLAFSDQDEQTDYFVASVSMPGKFANMLCTWRMTTQEKKIEEFYGLVTEQYRLSDEETYYSNVYAMFFDEMPGRASSSKIKDVLCFFNANSSQNQIKENCEHIEFYFDPASSK